MTRVDLTAVKAAAQDATEGPWYRLGDTLAVFTEDGETLVFDSGSKPDARYIAAVDPPTALAMAEALRIARDALESLRPSIHPQDAVTMKAEAALARMDALVDFGDDQ